MTFNYLLITVFLICYLQAGTSIRCYTCNSKDDPFCQLGQSKKGMDSTCFTQGGLPGEYCAKAIGYVKANSGKGEEWSVMRGCVREAEEKYSPFEFNGYRIDRGRLFICKRDLCNSSLITAPNCFIAAIVPLIVGLIINRN